MFKSQGPAIIDENHQWRDTTIFAAGRQSLNQSRCVYPDTEAVNFIACVILTVFKDGCGCQSVGCQSVFAHLSQPYFKILHYMDCYSQKL